MKNKANEQSPVVGPPGGSHSNLPSGRNQVQPFSTIQNDEYGTASRATVEHIDRSANRPLTRNMSTHSFDGRAGRLDDRSVITQDPINGLDNGSHQATDYANRNDFATLEIP